MSRPANWAQHKSNGSVSWPYTIFDIVYRTGKSNLVADALSQRPELDNQVNQKGSQDSDKEWEAISYPITTRGCIPDDHVCISNQILSQEITSIIGGTKLDVKLKEHLEIVGTAHESLGETEPIEVRSSLVNIFSHVTPKEMAEFQQADNQISAVYPVGKRRENTTEICLI